MKFYYAKLEINPEGATFGSTFRRPWDQLTLRCDNRYRVREVGHGQEQT